MFGKFSRSATLCSASSFSCSRYRVVFLLTLLPFAVALFAYALQWRGFYVDPIQFVAENEGPSAKIHISNPTSIPLPSNPSIRVQTRDMEFSFPSYGRWNFTHQQDLKPKVCITVTTSAGLDQILPWIFFHKIIGVGFFYIFAEGGAAVPEISEVLESIPGVNVIHRTEELEEKQTKSRIWNETWLERFFYKPCNHELFVRQTLNMEMGIAMARDSGMDWIIHVDTDELIHPSGTRRYSIRELFLGIPDDIDTVIFPNYESCVERDDIKEPFGEVSLFKKNRDHLSKDILYENYSGNLSYFLAYSNGKSAARVQDHLRPNGAHRWYNYVKNPIQAKTQDAAVLHYTYSMFSDLTSRRDRCSCKPLDEIVRRCFMLDFDRAAFIASSTLTEEEMLSWYNEHVVWSDGGTISSLLEKGILTRIYTPMVIFHVLRDLGLFGSTIA